jgi:hypothetical protein
MTPLVIILTCLGFLSAYISIEMAAIMFYKIGMGPVPDPDIKKVRRKYIRVSVVSTFIFIGCMSYALINWRGIDMLSSISVTSIGIITVLSISCSYANRQRKRETKKSSSQKGWIEFD